jgi:mRNA interferase HigB
MRVRLIKRRSIEAFVQANTRSRSSFRIWLAIISRADWNIPSDIKDTFKTADLLGNASERVVFNVGGNEYRMICSYHFGKTWVHLYVKWIGTHAAYTKLCSENKQYSINQF